jgi:hypothetical protein
VANLSDLALGNELLGERDGGNPAVVEIDDIDDPSLLRGGGHLPGLIE